MSWLKEVLLVALNGIKAKLDSVYTVIESAFAKLGVDLGAFKDTFVEHIVSFKDFMLEKLTGLLDGITNLKDKLVEKLSSIISTVGNIFDKIREIITHILDLPKKIGEMLKELFEKLFVPRDGYMQEKIDMLADKFPIVEDVRLISNSFKSFISGITSDRPPVVTLNLGSATNKYKYGGGTLNVLDMSWYAPYKKTSDALFGSFLWLVFSWRVIHRIPSIINGTSSTVSSVMRDAKGK